MVPMPLKAQDVQQRVQIVLQMLSNHCDHRPSSANDE
jgi:hypothetical protein